MPDSNAWPIIVSVLSGGAAGAVITAIATSIRNKRELAFKLVDRYVDDMFDKLAHAIDVMKTPQSMSAAGAWDKVTGVANWFEILATCYLEGHATGQILQSLGLLDEAKRVYVLMSNAKKIENGEQEPAYSNDELRSFRHLRRLVDGEKPLCDS